MPRQSNSNYHLFPPVAFLPYGIFGKKGKIFYWLSTQHLSSILSVMLTLNVLFRILSRIIKCVTIMAVEKVYESDNFLIINKPYDMYINSEDENEKNTVTYNIALRDSHLSTSSQPLHFVHRLDYATSGLLCIAKNKRAAAMAGKLFEKRESRKYYLAVVRGHAAIELCDIEFQVGSDETTAHTSHRMCVLRPSLSAQSCVRPRSAHSRLLVLETGYYDRDPVSVVLLKPITGRRHQLRVHCATIGHTILGDYIYSDTKDTKPHRMFLHATRLVLPIPQEPLDVQTPEPFFSDPRFIALWKPDRVFYKYRSKEDLAAVCDIIDKSYVIGVQYQLFKSS